MEEIVTAITPAIEKLAEVFNCSVDFIQAHMMEYILMYGKYACVTNITIFVCFWAILGLVIGAIIFFNILDEYKYNSDHPFRKSLLISFTAFIIVCIMAFVFAFCIWGIPYLVSPEMFSIQHLMDLIN